jgi:hypothetical protein
MKIIRPITVTDTGSFTRATTGTYYDSAGVLQTAAINAPRFNFNPANLAAGPSLLVEAAATNVLTYSEQFDNAIWTKANVTITPNAVAAPNGAVTAGFLKESSSTSSHSVSETSTVTAGAYTYSVYAKAATRSSIQLGAWDGAVGTDSVFNLTTGTVTSQGAGTTATITSVGGGWFRCAVTRTVVAGSSTFYTYLYNGSYTYAGDNTSGLYIWGAQLEASSAATSYIQSVASAVTRAADVNTAMLVTNVPEADYAAWSAATTYLVGQRVLDYTTHTIYESITGTSATVTASVASPSLITWNNHTLPANTPVIFSTTGTIPTGLTAGTTYYTLVDTVNTFKVSLTIGGTAVNVTGAGTGVLTATANGNKNNLPPSATYWLVAGSSNRWSMFDQSITSQTTQAGNIMVAVAPGARIDSVVGLNCTAATATINVVDPIYGNVYSKTIALTSYSGINDMFEYFYEPITQLKEFIVNDIPVGFSGATITICISGAGNAAIGGVVIGLAKEVGYSEWGAKVSLIDYSVKTKDAFGNYNITTRAFSKRADFSIKVETNTVDALQNLLAGYRGIPVVYVGSNSSADQQFASTIIYGFYKDFSIGIEYPTFSTCSLQVEGLT